MDIGVGSGIQDIEEPKPVETTKDFVAPEENGVPRTDSGVSLVDIKENNSSSESLSIPTTDGGVPLVDIKNNSSSSEELNIPTADNGKPIIDIKSSEEPVFQKTEPIADLTINESKPVDNGENVSIGFAEPVLITQEDSNQSNNNDLDDDDDDDPNDFS